MDSITMRSEQPRRSLLCVTAVHVMPVLVLIQGCSIGRSPLDPPSRARLKSGDEHRSMLEYAPYRPDVPYATPDLGDPRTAEEFVTLALSRNPSIRVAEAKVNRIRQRAPQARSLDDPMLTIAPVGEMAETAAGQVGLMSSLSQRLPLPSKLDARGRVAELEADQAEAEPIIGGLATSFIMELLVYPVIFYVLKGLRLPKASSLPAAPAGSSPLGSAPGVTADG